MSTAEEKVNDNNDIREIFNELDLNKDGKISVEELEIELNRFPDTQQPTEIMSILDTNNDELVDYTEFHDFVDKKEEKLREIFDHLDYNKDGKIDYHEIKESLSTLYHKKISEKDIKLMLSVVDTDNDGYVSFPEWRRFLLLVPPPPPVGDYKEILFEYWMKAAACVDIGENLSIPVNKSSGQWYHFVIAGGVAGGVSRTATAPLDRIKTVLQLNKGVERNLHFSEVVRSIFKDGSKDVGILGGMKAFFRGNGTNCIKIIPESSLKFFAYEYMKKFISIQRNQSNLGGLERFVAGATAGAIAQIAIYPLEVIKTRLAAPNSPYHGIHHTFISSVRSSEGVLSLYKGLSPSLLGIIPYAGIDLAVYEYLRGRFARFIETNKEVVPEKIAVLSPVICGTISSSVAQLISYPLNLVRTRLQAQGINNHSLPYTGMVDVFQRTVKEEGFKGLYRGILPNYLKVIPAVSISYTMYEYMKGYFGLH